MNILEQTYETATGDDYKIGDLFNATMIAEGQFDLAGISEDEITEEISLAAWQHLVNCGAAWTLQGFFGRTAASLIEQGLIEPAEGH